jgi:hypothetical protein
MKRTFRIALILTVWAGSLWVFFWLGFLKSQTIAIKVQHLDDLALLSDQKRILTAIDAGEVSKAKEDLKQRIAIGNLMAKMQVSPSFGVFDTLRYAIYPREAMSLISVSDSKDQTKKN